MKIAIICSSGLPVPAVKGGAIETLVEIIFDFYNIIYAIYF